MSLTDKAKNTKEKLAGEAKTKTGEATGDRSLEAEGRTEKAKGDLKNAGEKVKDAFKS